MLRALITGATHIDIFADTPLEFGSLNGRDLPGRFTVSIGGTAFNVCMGLRSSGVDCFLISAVRKHSLFTYLIRHELLRLKLPHFLITQENVRESAFLAIRQKGDLFIATTASAWDDLTWDDIKGSIENFLKKDFDFMIIDCNLPAHLQENILDAVNFPVYICVTSPVKATRFFELGSNTTKNVKAVFMNEEEFNVVSTLFRNPHNTEFIWFVTQGSRGVTVFNRKSKQHFDAPQITDAESFSGAGDAFASGVCYALETGLDISSAVQTGYKKVIEKLSHRHSNITPIDLTGVTKGFERDTLTGCLNRNTFEKEKDFLTLYSHIMIIDIDHFKKVNDTYGHDYGDRVLKTVAALIKKCIRDTDRVYRYGGEEFVLALYDTETEVAIRVAERIRQTVEEKSTVTVTIGISEINSSIEESLKQADMALYQGKNSGRNQIRFAPVENFEEVAQM